MDMKPGAGLSGGYLRSKSYVVALLLSKSADDPFCYRQLVGSLRSIDRKEFYFVLFVCETVEREISHFGVSVFYSASRGCDERHAASAEITRLYKRSRFMITFLVNGREGSVGRKYHVILQFTHCLERQSRHIPECAARFFESIVR